MFSHPCTSAVVNPVAKSVLESIILMLRDDDAESKPTKTSKKKKVSPQESASSTDVAMAGDPDPTSRTGTPAGKSSKKDKNAAKKAKRKAKKAS